MVSGGTYGTEDIVHGAGYGRAILILLLTPLLWSLPTAFMIGELSSALPFEGGYYAWVRRAMGNFWGFQEAWLSLVASIFDMAIYPTLFVAYLTRMFPWFQANHRGVLVALGVVIICAVLNIAGRQSGLDHFALAVLRLVGPLRGDLFLAPFKIHALRQRRHQADHLECRYPRRPAHLHVELHGMGQRLDHRHRSRAAAADLSAGDAVGGGHRALTYVLPFAAMWITGLPASAWETGAWADIAQLMGGPLLRIALVAGGMMSGFGMFNALVMSYSRLPLAMAQDGMLPKIFAKLHPKSRAPWVAILALAIGWGLALNLGFERLVTLDIMIYGASLTLEFVALIVLRFREPELKRPFRVPGGLFGAIAVGIPPTLLLGFAIVNSEHEAILGMSALWFGLIVMGAGVVVYAINHALKPTGWACPEPKPELAL